MKCNLRELAELLSSHSTRADIALLLSELRVQYDRPEFQRYDDLEGTNKLEKIISILSVMGTFGDEKVCLVCEIMKEIRTDDEKLHEGIDRLCQRKPDDGGGKSHSSRRSGSVVITVSVVITLIVASSVFASLLFAIVATFKWAMGRNMEPMDFIILTPVAVVLALVLYPFILVLLNIFSPQMAQEQFNRLHDFAESSFPTLLHWLDRFSRFFKSQQTDQLSPEAKRENPPDQSKKATANKSTQPDSLKAATRAQLAQHRRTLAHLKQKAAMFSPLERPTSLLNEIEDEEQTIAEFEARLAQLEDSG